MSSPRLSQALAALASSLSVLLVLQSEQLVILAMVWTNTQSSCSMCPRSEQHVEDELISAMKTDEDCSHVSHVSHALTTILCAFVICISYSHNSTTLRQLYVNGDILQDLTSKDSSEVVVNCSVLQRALQQPEDHSFREPVCWISWFLYGAPQNSTSWHIVDTL